MFGKNYFSGKNVFLTGGSRGIGRQILRQFESEGANVIAPVRDELDLLSNQSIESYIKNHGEDIDIFIHCAGLNVLSGIEDTDFDVMNHLFMVNYFSAVELMKAFLPHMKKSGWGRFVCLSSLYAFVSKEKRIAYSSSKNALTGLVKSLAVELTRYGILSNGVAPGYVLTDMTLQNLTGQEIEEICSSIPAGRLQTEEEIANVVMFLCSDFNNSISGQIIAVDGGFLSK